jgi:hypothetical protein
MLATGRAATLWQRLKCARVQVCSFLGLLGVGIALAGPSPTVYAEPTLGREPLQCNSNRTPAGVFGSGVLTIDLEVREGEWFPEDEHGPSVKIFALAE